MCTLYDRITNLCKEKNVSRSKMCLDLGLSKSTMSNMKSGRTSGVSTSTAQKIASYFNVSVGYLLGEEENTEIKKSPSELSEGEQKLLDLFRRIPESQHSMVELLLESFGKIPEGQQPMVLQMIDVALKNLK